MCQISFHTTAEMLDDIPPPFPASQHMPEWFKNLPADWEQGGTLKRCPPFLTAMGAGYLIPAPADTLLRVTESGEFRESGKYSLFSGHFPQQFAGAPFAGARVLKFDNPWIIVTPPEYVCLITGPVNRFEMPFVPLTGIVETGTYYKQVKLPTICLLGPGKSFLLRRGTPMIQVIPIRREEWTHEAAVLNREHNNEQQALFDANPHAYKENYWKRLLFG
jgi:hypothetical protein